MNPRTASTLAAWALELDFSDLPDAVIANAASASMPDIDDGQPTRLWRYQRRNRASTHDPDEFGRAR